MKNFKKKQFFLYLIFLSLFFLTFFFKSQFQNFLYVTFFPFQRIFWKTGQFLGNLSFPFSAWKVEKENEKLKKELEFLRSEILKLKLLEEENELLRKALNLEKENFKIFPSKISAKNIDSDYILITGGEKDGIKKGMVVIDEDYHLIGKITETFLNFSKVQLIFSKGVKFDGELLNPKVNFLVEGLGNYKLKLQFLPPDLNLVGEEIIFTSSLSGNFPPGLLVGKIEKIDFKNSSAFLEGEGRVFFNLKDLDNVFIIKNFLPWEKN